jgi:antitoxin VapB
MKPTKRKRKSAKDAGHGVAEPPPPPYAHEPATARVFQSGNSQAVRLPKEFRLRSKEVQIFRRGRDIVLREKPAQLSELIAGLPALPRDALPDAIPDRPAESIEAP